jgi:aspartate/methionine/tyrosine aminotransferase
MTRLANRHGAVNLAQGFPDFPAPEEPKEAARAAIGADINQYAITWGARPLREAIAAKVAAFQGVTVDPETEITVTCGATEGMLDVLLALVDPGDEVVVIAPFYENYGPDAVLCGAVPRYVRLRPPDWVLDVDELAAAFGPRTRAVIVNTPHNPTGKVFTAAEIVAIGELCERWNAALVTDEIYEHITYGAARHISPLELAGLRTRTVVVNSVSKPYSLTGWRVGWVIASPFLTAAIRKVHDFVTVGAAAPLQEGAARALALPASYYDDLAAAYAARRAGMLAMLAGLRHRLRGPPTHPVLLLQARRDARRRGRPPGAVARLTAQSRGNAGRTSNVVTRAERDARPHMGASAGRVSRARAAPGDHPIENQSTCHPAQPPTRIAFGPEAATLAAGFVAPDRGAATS